MVGWAPSRTESGGGRREDWSTVISRAIVPSHQTEEMKLNTQNNMGCMMTLAIVALAPAMVAGCGNVDSGRPPGGSGTASTTSTSSGESTDSATVTTTDSTGSSASGGTSTTDATSGGSSTGAPSDGTRFDLGVPDVPPGDETGGDCGGGGMPGDVEFSFIWIANSPEGTVSKINTKTGVEEGRYWTDPIMRTGSPSRTSVSLLGDVAVSNRDRCSTTKIAAREARCLDINGNGTIETSTGAANVLDWGTDECVLWTTTFPDCRSGITGPRPTQWEAGEKDQNGCVESNPRLWVAYMDQASNAVYRRLDGATGAILDTATYPWSGGGHGWGPYGGVVNAEGDLFASGLDNASLIHVDAVTLAVTDHGNPGTSFYGIGIDADGNPWMAGGNSVSIFDDLTKQFVVVPVDNEYLRGIQIDSDGRAWAAGNAPCGLVELDVATRSVTTQHVNLPQCGAPVGVSIDVEGFVWSPDQLANIAFKLDPSNYQVTLTVGGLVSPYTYSDMTGAGLALVGNPPQG